jgi:hypothetical protein
LEVVPIKVCGQSVSEWDKKEQRYRPYQ